jgi:LmbE family N-acetylglucosaminyl deacetylase
MSATVIELTTPSTTRGHVRPHVAGEVAVLVVLLFVYDQLRGLTGVRRPPALQHGWAVLHLDRHVTRGAELSFNHWLAAQAGLVRWLSIGYYQFMHIGAAMVVLAWCYIKRPDVYRPARNALVVTNAIGLLVFALYPVAPPRLLPGSGVLDMVASAGFGRSHGPVPIIEYGAVPSLHMAWAVWVAIVACSFVGSRTLRAAVLLHPVVMAIVVVGTGNHYLFDVVTGSALGFAASGATGLLPRFASLGRSGGHRARAEHMSAPAPIPGVSTDPATRRYTLVAFHAHPDDETFLTGGTLAAAAAAGHGTVIVVATLGEAGLTGAALSDAELGEHRLAELRAAAAVLGCSRVEWLGYRDSGLDGMSSAAGTFAGADLDTAAGRLATILRSEQADVVTIYDPAGGYGHPDHQQVHRVGRLAADRAGTPVVLEATVDRRAILRLTRALRIVPGLPPEFRPARLAQSFTPHTLITHRVDVRRYASVKRAAMAAHGSQRSGGRTPRSLAVFMRLPRPIFRRVFGHEWFVEIGRSPGDRPIGDVFATLDEVPG